MPESAPLPAVGAPARRALDAAGIRTLDDLRRHGLRDIGALHGVGPTAVRILEAALAAEDDGPVRSA
jgi:hypothetical protein